MSNAPLTAPPAPPVPRRTRRTGVWHFVRHYLEMVVAMFLGMVALHPLWTFAADRLGLADLLARTDVMAMVMATDMTLAMAGWMAFRGHRWRPIAEMAAAMYLPFVVFLPPLWAGLVTGETLMTAGHVLMLFAMAGVMLLRPDEYAHAHHAHHAHHEDAHRDDQPA